MHLKICGNRNSYSKTDKNATFMRMKEDQLKPAYNLQIGVNSEYIVGLDLFPNPTDVRTLVPFLSVLESKNLKFKNIVADAGYESEENYEYLFNNNYTPYIKPQNYEKQKICHLMKKPIHIHVQIIRNLNSNIRQNKKIEVGIYRKREYMNVTTVKDAFLQ